MLGHFATAIVMIAAVLVGLQIVGVDPVYAISSAGFLGLALALSGQDVIRNLLAGTTALLEDRYAVGDQVVVIVGGSEVAGTIDLMGPASIRVRTEARCDMACRALFDRVGHELLPARRQFGDSDPDRPMERGRRRCGAAALGRF